MGEPDIIIMHYFLCKAYKKTGGHRRDFNLKVHICLELGLFILIREETICYHLSTFL